jgi:hypothetical protein
MTPCVHDESTGRPEFLHLAHGDDPLGEAATRTVRAAVNEAEQDLKDLDGLLVSLHAKKAKIGSFLEDHRALLSPLRTLPFELLGKYFVNLFPNGPSHQAPGAIEHPGTLLKFAEDGEQWHCHCPRFGATHAFPIILQGYHWQSSGIWTGSLLNS